MSPNPNDAEARLLDRMRRAVDTRVANATERRLRPRAAASTTRDLSNNDYLGLARHPAVIEAACAATRRWGASSSASPLITGYTDEHADFEREVAAWHGFAHGLVWNTGFAANAAVLGSLPKPGDLVLADRLIHASMIAGLLGSGARLRRFPHLDLRKLRALLVEHRGHDGVVWVVTESVYSMDGDYPDLRELARLKAEFGFVLIVDEAHATGWHGPEGAGLCRREGVTESVDILVGTLGKGLGGAGAYTLFHEELFRRHLINFAGEFIYSTYLPPACAAAGRAAIRELRRQFAAGIDPEVESRRWRTALRRVVGGVPEGDSPIIPIPLGDAERTTRIAARLEALGWKVGAIRPPTVPEGGSRLRVSLKYGHPDADPEAFAAALAEALRHEA